MVKKLLFIAGLFIFICGCKPVPNVIILDSFEGQLNNKTVDFGASEGSSVIVSASTDIKSRGNQSLKIEYDLKNSGYMWIARGYDLDIEGAAVWEIIPKKVPWRKYDAISLDMYGTAAGGAVAFDLKDSGGEIWRYIIKDDFLGWKTVTIAFKDFFSRKDWQPPAATINGVLNFPIKSFQFEPRLPGNGVYYFDAVRVERKNK